MKRLIISVKTGPTSNIYDLDVPGDSPLSDLIQHIAEALELPATNSEGQKLIYWCCDQNGELIDSAKTLISAGVNNSDLVLIDWGTSQPANWQKITNAPGDKISTATQQSISGGQLTGVKPQDVKDNGSGIKRKVPDDGIPEGWIKIS